MVAPTSEASSIPRTAAVARETPESVEARHAADLFVRTSWVDAALALAELEKGKIDGGRSALWVRAWLQEQLFVLGCFLQGHAGKVLFVAILVLTTFCVGLKSAQVHSRVDQLWVQEGGRLEAELRYTAHALGEADSSTHQLIIQTAEDADASVLHPGALLEHLKVVRAAAQVTVHMFDITWRLKDICYSPSIPAFDEEHYIEQIFDNIIPCSIVTPLDCFWEGSKLLGPDYPVRVPGLNNPIQWTNLNPTLMVKQIKAMQYDFPFSMLESYMKRAGISTGYTEKPCLDPTDKECPDTAPNKKSGLKPDVASELTSGCYGFAASYMHWPEQLVVGGAVHNKTGQLRSARALQTVVQLMGEREFFDYFSNNYKVHHVGWSQEKAAAVLDAWQRKFAEEVRKLMKADTASTYYSFYAFSTATLNDILGKFSELSLTNIVVGYVLMLFYVAVTLIKWQDPVRSQAGVGIAGVLLLSITVAAGLGFCALLGIPFNASTTQIVPFLALGLGVDDMFLLTHTYVEQSCGDVPREEQTGVVLKKTGLSVLLTSLCNVIAFFAAALLPIPALRVFSLQAAILLLFNLAAMLLVFPAMISLDLRRRSAYRSDVLCCFIPEQNNPPPRYPSGDRGKKRQAVTRALPPDRLQTVTSIIDKGNWKDSSREPLDPESGAVRSGCHAPSCLSLTLTTIARNHYGPFIMKPAVKVVSMLTLIFVLLASIYGASKVIDGLDLTDIVPENTDEYKFLSMQEKYFGFYNMYAVTQGDFEYPTNQKLLYEYHEAFVRIPNIIKNDNGGLPKFWLSLFRDWLQDLQKAYDQDYAKGCITQEGWFHNTSNEGSLAYKLLVQTGHVDNPVDKSLLTQVRLVDDEGIINPNAFYNYLSAWKSNDAATYGASQGNLKPEPKPWFHSASDKDLKIPKSSPLIYTQLPFYLYGLSDTENIKSLITLVRNLCVRFEAKGLANYPSGIPFVFWEQYLHLRPSLALALACALGAVFVVVTILLLNVWAALLVTLALVALVLQLLGAMAALNIKLSAIPAVLLIVAVGIGVHFTVHLCLGFVTSIGGRVRRSRLALEQTFAPVVHGALATLLAVTMLAGSEFGFVARHFLWMLLTLIAAGLVNGLLFFPVLLALIGPTAEVRPLQHPERLSTPSPKGSPKHQRRSSNSSSLRDTPSRLSKGTAPQRPPSTSLTTITEEPPSWHSSAQSVQSSMQSIVVQPEVVVETTTYNADPNSGGSGRSTPTSKSSHSSGAITTKVTATANIKVEVLTPMPSDRNKSRRSYHYYDRRRDRDYDTHDRRDRDRDHRDGYESRRDRDRERNRDRNRDIERVYYYNHRENGRDSGHESDGSRH